MSESGREAESPQRTLAPFARRLLPVTAVERLGAYHVLRVADAEGSTPQPGQFAMLSTAAGWGAGEDQRPFLARAFSIARHRDGESHFLLEDVGPGTKRLCELQAGESVWALGPLGRGFTPPEEGRRAILLGGGVGIAPLAILQDQLEGSPSRDDAVTVLLGFRDRAHAYGAGLLDGPRRPGRARVATDDGSTGHHGFVTELLVADLERDPEASVYACGPPAMLESVRAICAELAIPVQLALEAGMACGFGACFGCVVPKRDGGYLRVCVDGPVVDGHELERVEEPVGETL